MARLNEILVGRVNRGYQRLFGIKGSPPVATVAPEIMPSHVIFSGTEERYLQSWNRYGQQLHVAAVAAVNSAIRLRNPSGSNVVAVIELLYAYETVADNLLQVALGAVGTDLAAAHGAGRLDARSATANTALSLSSGTNAAGFGATLQAMTVGANTMPPFPFISTDIQEIPLLPGDAIQLVTGAVNTTLDASILWRERFLEDSERT